MADISSNNTSDNIVIKTIKKAPKHELVQLYKDAGWWEPSWDSRSDFLNCIVKDSALFVGAFYEGKLIGMGRALSDLASDAYIQDVAVLKEFQGEGTGEKIIKKLIALLKENHVDWIGLIAQPGTSSFYKRLGFEPLKDHTPLKFKI
ncbi:MAG: GNAT family N-acetyltransferase [Thermodesulfobacteriota bacterium]